MNYSDSIATALATGGAGIGSQILLSQSSQSDVVQVVTIVCSAVIAITHIVFGYLIYSQTKKNEK